MILWEMRSIIDEASRIAKDFAREQAVARADSRIEEIIAGGSSIVPVSDDMRTQMRQRTVDLYQQIRKVVANDELFFAYCGRVFDGETMY